MKKFVAKEDSESDSGILLETDSEGSEDFLIERRDMMEVIRKPVIQKVKSLDNLIAYHTVVDSRRLDRAGRRAESFSNKAGRLAAKTIVWLANWNADNKLVLPLLIWAAVPLTGLFYWAGSLLSSIINGSQIGGPSVKVYSDYVKSVFLVGAIISALVYKAVWKKIRGTKKPGHTPFVNYIVIPTPSAGLERVGDKRGSCKIDNANNLPASFPDIKV